MTIIIKVECNNSIGSGHLMRMLALSQELVRRIDEEIVFILNNTPEFYKKLVQSKGHSYIDMNTSLQEEKSVIFKVIRDIKPKLIVTDSYLVDSDYIKSIKKQYGKGLLLCISDFADAEYTGADFVVNHNIYGEELKYKVGPATVVLAGEKYAILRDEFKQKIERKIRKPPKALVTFGGLDPQNLTFKAAEALSKMELETAVVVGAMHKDFENIKKLESSSLKVLHNVNNMHELMWSADFALASGGTTTYELLATELPSVFFKIADNQRLIVETIEKRKLGLYGGEGNKVAKEGLRKLITKMIDVHTRETVYKNIKGLIDGRGKQRIVTRIIERL